MFTWNFGSVYKTIRRSKGLTQKKVCGGFLSMTTLSKIENHHVVPSVEHMIFLLDQLNMSVEEFHYICNLYQPSNRQKIFSQYQKVAQKPKIAEIQRLIDSCDDYLSKQHDVPVEHLRSVLKIVLFMRQHGPNKKDREFEQLTEKIYHYLDKQDTWYMSDLKLLQTILYAFPVKNLPHLTKRIFESLEKYKDFHNIKEAQVSILTNVSTIYFYNQLLKDCEKITLRTLELAKKLKRYDSLGFAQVRLGICRGDDALIENGLAILRLTDEQDLLTMLEDEVKKYR
ncbi:helix-turn-helix domain-containing protein [Streptococcus oriscaviae]|uniref:Helix-turn-helix transcriptional regulator n=1 Tax=Streptococcus oriscaviae TaxID=2781599 RepID=A0ABX7YHX8_9STRE|nr:helix-turn-helix transcriptional regulator [Streptococcus oriscaviae]QUE53377.1 helix-turn-helix transcriptional regulator [Streptococcus oriscaviae]